MKRHIGRDAVIAALALGGAVGCSLSDSATQGELNQGGFAYETVGDGRSDVVMRAPVTDYTGIIKVPLVAVGGAFKLKFIPKSGSGSEWGTDQLIPAAPGLIAREGASFVAKRPGQSAVLANDGSVVQDFIHVQVKLVDHIQIIQAGSGGDTPLGDADVVAMTLGQPAVTVVAQPVSAIGEVLAGALPYAWSISGDADVTLSSTGGYENGLATGSKSGTATVTLSVAGKSASIHVQVNP